MTSSGNHEDHHHEVFSPEKAAHLDGSLRRFIYRPDKLAEKYVRPKSRVLDFGCGPGFFTRAFTKRVGEGGQVFAVDLQDEMLSILQKRLGPDGLLSRITTHRCAPDTIGLPTNLDGTFDCAFAIFVVHEVPDPERLFREIFGLLKPGGTFYYSEPPFIVSGREFRDHLAEAEKAGFRVAGRKWYFVNRAAVLMKE